ncbi:DUF6541 family protein [Trueperella pecoris]
MAQALLVACALLVANFLPGYALARALRTPRSVALALGPAITLTVVGAISLAFHFAGVRWSFVSFTGALAVLVGLAYLCSFALRLDRWPLPERSRRTAGSVALAVAVLIIPLLLTVDFGLPSSQADPMYHYNAIRAIVHHGDASMLGAMQANYGLQTISTSYPATWHAILALLGESVNPVLSSHVFAYVVIPILWCLSLLFLARVVLPAPSAALVPLVATLLVSFPTFLALSRGFWPNVLAIAQIPAVFGVIVVAWRQANSSAARMRDVVAYGLLIMGMLAGLGLTHPSAVFSVVWALIPAALYAVVRVFGANVSARRRRRVLLAAVGLVAFAALLISPATVRGYIFRKHPRNWNTSERLATLADALGDLPLIVPIGAAAGIVVVVIVLVYALRVAWRIPSLRWVVLAWLAQWPLIFGAYVNGNVFSYAAGIWYHDPHRLLAVQTIFTSLILGALFGRLSRRKLWRSGVVVLTIATLAQVAVVRGPSQPPIGEGKMMTQSDFEFFTQLDRYVPAGAVVLGDPASGLGYAPVYSGIDTTHTQVNRTMVDRDGTYLAQYFDQLHEDPLLCSILEHYGVTYFYQVDDFVFQKRARSVRWPGLYGVDTSLGFEKVATTDRGTLWRITACRDVTPIEWWDTPSRRTGLISEQMIEEKSRQMPERG